MATNYYIKGQNFEDLFVKKSLFIPGGLWAWGGNTNGVLGDNTITHRSSPVQTSGGGSIWKLVNGGKYQSAGIKTDGTLWTWGSNSGGQLGNNTINARYSPGTTISGGSDWKLVASGAYHMAAIKTDGTLWTWGSNFRGQLGDNTTTDKSSPVQTVAGGTNWKQITCGHRHNAAIKTDGTLWLWGVNSSGSLGDGTIVNKSSPVQTVSTGNDWKFVSCGNYNTAAIKTDGTLWLWGPNNYGQLGDGTVTYKSSPVQTVSSGTNWKQVACGTGGQTAAIKTDGTLWLWGNNVVGQLGNNDSTNKSSPVQTVSGGTNWKQVSGGDSHTAAIKTDGTLWTWGQNPVGQLGNNTGGTRYSSPIQTVAGGTNWKLVSCGYTYTCAIRDFWI